MDDVDSGIYQSRTDSVVDGAEVQSSTTVKDRSNLSDSDTSGNDLDELSEFSSADDDGITSSSYSTDSEDKDISPISYQPQPPKKKLSLSDSFLLNHKTAQIQSAPDLEPGMKMKFKEGEREEKWEFSNGSGIKDSQSSLTCETSDKTSHNSKKVLKLQLSACPSEQLSDFTLSPEALDEDCTQEFGNTATSSPLDSDISDPEPSAIYLELRDPDKSQCSEWRRVFASHENVTVQCRDFFLSKFDHDAVIVPGNSFGFLDGEPEFRFTEKFGWQIQRKVQKHIREVNDGEMLVGDALIIRLERDEFENLTSIKFVIYVPIMRVPLQVGDTVNAYLAFRAAMRAVRSHNQHCPPEDEIMTVLSPSLCSGLGNMPPGRIALQMKEAYSSTVLYQEKSRGIKELGALATHHVDMTTKSGSWC